MLRDFLREVRLRSRIEAIRSRTRFFQSGMLDSCYSADGGDELLPALLLRTKFLPSLRGQTVISPPPLPSLLHPPALDPPLFLQPMEQGIERCNVKSQSP